jgi:hypothetical protein
MKLGHTGKLGRMLQGSLWKPRVTEIGRVGPSIMATGLVSVWFLSTVFNQVW